MPFTLLAIGFCGITRSAIWEVLDKDDDLRASHELLNTKSIL